MTSSLATTVPSAGTTAPTSGRRVRYAVEFSGFPDAPGALVIIGLIFLKPNIAGETMIVIGAGLTAVAAAITLLRRDRDPLAPDESSRAMSLVAGFLIAAYLTIVIKTAAMDPLSWVAWTLQDLVLTGGTAVAFVVVVQNRRNRIVIARGFVLIVALACTSYAITAMMWSALGLGYGEVTQVVVGNFGLQSVYFPFTTTAETQYVFGLVTGQVPFGVASRS